jgi:hypothetical protein
MSLWKFTLLALLTAVATAPKKAQADDPCAFLDTNQKRTNCRALLQGNQIPNKEALLYTLAYMEANTGRLADARCLPKRTESVGMSSAKLKKGIRNTCQFIINDVNTKWRGYPHRSNAYFVDLCASDSRKIVRAFYMNKGTGTEKSKYADRDGAHATNLGAYLTGDQVFSFNPYRMTAPYQAIVKRRGRIPAVRLFGVQSTNNDTSLSKPMHVSPYYSSWGCPSIAPDNAWMLTTLAKSGPSLVMNYGPSKYHPISSVHSCQPDQRSGSRITRTNPALLRRAQGVQ